MIHATCSHARQVGTGLRSLWVAALQLAWMALAIGAVARAETEDQGWSRLRQYRGRVESVNVDGCGQRPGSCEGTITLMRRHGGEVTLAIRPEMWIKRGERLVHLEDLRVGDEIHVHAFEAPGEGAKRAGERSVGPCAMCS